MAAADLLAAQPGPDRGGDPQRRSPATSAAAPATTTSSRRCSTPPAQARRGARAGACPSRETRKSCARGVGGMSAHGTSGNGLTSAERMRRKEDPPLIQGRGNYIDDIALPAACSTPRSCARPRRTRGSPRSTRRRRSRATGVEAVFTGKDLDLEAGLPAGLGAARRRGQGARALAARQGRGQARRRPGRGRHRHATATPSSTPPRTYRRVRPAARRRRPRGGARGRRAARPRRLGTNKVHEWSLRRRRRERARATPRSSSSAASSTTAPRARRSSRAA